MHMDGIRNPLNFVLRTLFTIVVRLDCVWIVSASVTNGCTFFHEAKRVGRMTVSREKSMWCFPVRFCSFTRRGVPVVWMNHLPGKTG